MHEATSVFLNLLSFFVYYYIICFRETSVACCPKLCLCNVWEECSVNIYQGHLTYDAVYLQCFSDYILSIGENTY